MSSGHPQGCCPPQLHRVPGRKNRSLGYGDQCKIWWGPFLDWSASSYVGGSMGGLADLSICPLYPLLACPPVVQTSEGHGILGHPPHCNTCGTQLDAHSRGHFAGQGASILCGPHIVGSCAYSAGWTSPSFLQLRTYLLDDTSYHAVGRTPGSTSCIVLDSPMVLGRCWCGLLQTLCCNQWTQCLGMSSLITEPPITVHLQSHSCELIDAGAGKSESVICESKI